MRAERHHPLIEQVRDELVRSYVGMITRLNRELANVLRKARGLEKGPCLYVVPGGSSDTYGSLGTDLFKARAPSAPKAKAPQVKAPKAASAERPDVKHPGIKGGKWYRDDHGHVKYGERPTKRFHTALTDEEAAQLHANPVNVLSEITGKSFSTLSKRMAEILGTDQDRIIGVLGSLQIASANSMALGISAEDYFADLFVRHLGEQGIAEVAFDEEGKPVITPELHDSAMNMYSKLINTFKQTVEDPKFKQMAQEALAERRKQTVLLADKVEVQRKIVKGHFEKFLTGDVQAEAIKQLSIMWDLGLVHVPLNKQQARAFATSAKQAAKIVDTVQMDEDRIKALVSSADTLSPEQQLAASMALMLSKEIKERNNDASYDRDTLLGAHSDSDTIKALNSWLNAGDKKYSDAELSQIQDRVLAVNKALSDHILEYNNQQNGVAIKALRHETTSVKKLFKDESEATKIRDSGIALEEQRRRSIEAQSNEAYPTNPDVLTGMRKGLGDDQADLLKHQKAYSAWMIEQKRGIVAAGTGLGKTAIAINVIAELLKQKKTKRGIIVVPPSLVKQWPKEIQAFWPDAKVQVVASELLDEKVSLEERLAMLDAINTGELAADVVVMSAGTLEVTKETKQKIEALGADYEKAHGVKLSEGELYQLAEEKGFIAEDPLMKALSGLDGAVFFDECHSAATGLKDPANMGHRLAKEMLKNREYAFGMTATPAPNGPEDMFHLLNLFSPGSAGESLERFNNRMVEFEEIEDPETGRKILMPMALDMKEMAAAKEAFKHALYIRSKTDNRIIEDMTQAAARKGDKFKFPDLVAVSHTLQMSPVASDEYSACSQIGYDEGKKIVPYNVDEKGNVVGYPEDYETDNEMIARMEDEGKTPKQIKSALNFRLFTRKQKAAISPKLVNRDYKGDSPKIDHGVEMVQRHFADPANHDKPFIFPCSYVGGLQMMKEALMEKLHIPEHLIGEISGRIDQKERDTTQEAANQGKLKIVLLGIKAGGAGLNLQKAANRMYFLDKPWAPADVEQVVGRGYRFGNPADKFYVHHSNVIGTTDERKYEKLRSKISLTETLAYADIGEQYMNAQVAEAYKRLIGTFDKDATNWSPEQEKEMLKMGGLSEGDLPPVESLQVFREKFDRQAFGEKIEKERFDKMGDDEIEALHTMSGILHKRGLITDRQFYNKRKKIAEFSGKWLAGKKNKQEWIKHPIARFTGDQFLFGPESAAEVNTNHAFVGVHEVKNPAVKKGTGKTLQSDVGAMPISAKPNIMKFELGTNLKLGDTKKNPYHKDSRMWVWWEVIRRTKPESVEEAVDNLANEYEDDFGGSVAKAKEALLARLKQEDIFGKLAKDGFVRAA